MYTAQLDRVPGKDNMQFTSVVRCQKSFDGGRTWGPYETVFPEEGTFCRQPIQVLSNGRWIFSNWICTDSADGLSGDPTAFRLSDDEGKTWRMVMMPRSNGHVHANVVELEPGHLVAFMRNREAYRIHRSESFDWGETWTEPKPTPLPNNNSSISATKLASGRIAVAYNPTSVRVPLSHAGEGRRPAPGLRRPHPAGDQIRPLPRGGRPGRPAGAGGPVQPHRRPGDQIKRAFQKDLPLHRRRFLC